VKRNASKADARTGDFIVCKDADYGRAVWPGAEVVVVECIQDMHGCWGGRVVVRA